MNHSASLGWVRAAESAVTLPPHVDQDRNAEKDADSFHCSHVLVSASSQPLA